jgi:hypothetical protein
VRKLLMDVPALSRWLERVAAEGDHDRA